MSGAPTVGGGGMALSPGQPGQNYGNLNQPYHMGPGEETPILGFADDLSPAQGKSKLPTISLKPMVH